MPACPGKLPTLRLAVKAVKLRNQSLPKETIAAERRLNYGTRQKLFKLTHSQDNTFL